LIKGIENILSRTKTKEKSSSKKKTMETTFKNKVALVTGGSSGIGRATAIASAKRSQSSRGRLEENDEMVDLKELGSEAIFYQMRCLKTDDVKAMVADNCRIWPIGLCVQQCRNRGCSSVLPKIAPRKTGTKHWCKPERSYCEI
jgi:hypothetical protein